MREIKEIEIDGEKVSLVKGKNNWRIVKPWKVNGKLNWKNILIGGSWTNLFVVSFLVIIILGFINEYVNNLKIASACLRALPDYINLVPYIENSNLNYTLGLP